MSTFRFSAFLLFASFPLHKPGGFPRWGLPFLLCRGNLINFYHDWVVVSVFFCNFADNILTFYCMQ